MDKLQTDYIKKALSPVDFYRHELPNAPLKRQGWNDGGLCPFHADNKPGSFRVNLETGAYRCFACGTAGGDIIAFTMALYGLKFVEALAQLARYWGMLDVIKTATAKRLLCHSSSATVQDGRQALTRTRGPYSA